MSEALLFSFSLIDTGAVIFLLVYFWTLIKLLAHAILIPLFLLYQYWWLVLINVPGVAWMAYEYLSVPSGNTGVYDPTEIYKRGQLKKHMRDCLIFLVCEEVDKSWLSNRKLSGCGRVLFVTAHPDDECMFFGPTILSLVQSKAQVNIVCLSLGDLYGRGKNRKKELWLACETLGIDSSLIWLYNHDKLKDDPKVEWRAGLVASIILRTVETLDIDTIITFDKKGVSGHKNHTSIYRAMSLLKSRNSLPSTCRVYLLESVSILRKYTFYADLLLSVLFRNSYLYVCSRKEHKLIVSAMSKHVTQYVWYRKLFMLFSSYVPFS
uniref:N-acetylglucosaminylphosphatidylinositol deacetylase n=1 Tax=Rhodnius prolixus TaxID=13249 RepID=T1HH69_RHOPR